MRRHVISVLVVWAVLLAIGEALAFTDLYPAVAAVEAEDFDRIFTILLVMGMPVFTGALAMLGYCVFVFGRSAKPTEDGPAYKGTGRAPIIWVGVTSALTLLVMIFPGLTGLAALQADEDGYGWGDPSADLTVNVTAFRFGWEISFPDAGGFKVNSATEDFLYLPVDTKIKFNVQSSDVIHSFWIPAFRMKIDTLPGRTTFFTVEVIATGEYDDDSAFRVQCAELCGVDHGLMAFPLKVVERAEFDQWVASHTAGGGN
jgi:cytochrome c oxidase subunit 2